MITKESYSINLVKISLSILFLLCLLDWQYGFYQLVRFLGMIGFGILAYNEYEENKNWFVVWISSLILIRKQDDACCRLVPILKRVGVA